MCKCLKTNEPSEIKDGEIVRFKIVDVTKRLPEISGTYLVIGKSGTIYTTHFYKNENEQGHFSRDHVTHWLEAI